MALVREQTIATERPPPVGEVSANFCGYMNYYEKKYVGIGRIVHAHTHRPQQFAALWTVNPYPTAFPYGNGMVLHFYQQQESSTTKTVHKVINKGLKTYV